MFFNLCLQIATRSSGSRDKADSCKDFTPKQIFSDHMHSNQLGKDSQK